MTGNGVNTLVVLEVSQKQNYIFRTNRLKENIGASIIIREVTELLPDRFLDRNNGVPVSMGGGKSIFEFETYDAAVTFIKEITTYVLQNYPGLEMFAASIKYDPESDLLIDVIKDLHSLLAAKKQARRSSFALYGLGMTECSTDSQAPAVARLEEYDEQGKGIYRLVSAECMAKIVKAENQELFFQDILPDEPGYRFANSFEELGGTRNVKNMIAIIYIDGNKMGVKIGRFCANFRKATKKKPIKEANDLYRKEFNALSKDLDDKFHAAVKQATCTLARHLGEMLANGQLSPNYQRDGKLILPMRPLILSGDDICIVSDARIGVQLATQILRNIDASKPVKVKGDRMPLHACAGIAMVRTSYPFSRAHELAEELCENAKAILPLDPAKDESVLDFMLVQGEIAGSLTQIRQERYLGGALTSKPYYIGRSDKQGNVTDNRANSLPYYEDRMNCLKDKVSRGTLKEYRVALAKGRSSADEYVHHMRMADSIGEGSSYVIIDGQERCIDYDVIEMMDLYFRED